MNEAITAAVFAVFEVADMSAVGFCERLLALGIGDKAAAKPYALAWAAEAYDTNIEQGNQGPRLPRNSDAERAMYRVLNRCFESVPKDGADSVRKSVDPVESMVRKAAKLDKRQIKRLIAALQAL